MSKLALKFNCLNGHIDDNRFSSEEWYITKTLSCVLKIGYQYTVVAGIEPGIFVIQKPSSVRYDSGLINITHSLY